MWVSCMWSTSNRTCARVIKYTITIMITITSTSTSTTTITGTRNSDGLRNIIMKRMLTNGL